MSSSSQCVVCPPGGGPCFEGPCSSAPSSGTVVASGTFGGTPDWAYAAGAAAAIGTFVLVAKVANRGKPLVRQSRPRR